MRLPAGLRGRLLGESGYSLIELLMVLAILGTVLGALVTVFVTGSHAEASINSRFQAQLQARMALDKLRREVHCANALTATTTSMTLTLPTPTGGSLPCPTGVGQFTWCTSGSGQRYGLYRVAGATCTTTGAVRWADYLVSANAFPSPTILAATQTQLARLHVSLAVNPMPTKPGTYTLVDDGTYTLVDDVVLRNSSRLP